MTPIWTIGDGTRTQMAMRADGAWFMHKRDQGAHGDLWGKWTRQVRRPHAIGSWIDPKAGFGRLPCALQLLRGASCAAQATRALHAVATVPKLWCQDVSG